MRQLTLSPSVFAADHEDDALNQLMDVPVDEPCELGQGLEFGAASDSDVADSPRQDCVYRRGILC